MPKRLTKTDLIGLLEPEIVSRLPDTDYVIEYVDPVQLVSHNRLDVGFLTLCLELTERSSELAREVCQHGFQAQWFDSLVDRDRPEEIHLEAITSAFEEQSNKLGPIGNDAPRSLVPVSSSGSILSGGDRVAAALHARKTIGIVRTGLPANSRDYNYFHHKHVPVSIIELAVLKTLDFLQNTYIVFLWPNSKEHWGEAESLFRNVVYRKDFEFSFQGALNLLRQCYRDMNWNEKELQHKRLKCFPCSLTARILIFQEGGGPERVREIKNEFRELCGVGYHSIHTGDSPEEAVRLGLYLLDGEPSQLINDANDRRGVSRERLDVLNERSFWKRRLERMKQEHAYFRSRPRERLIRKAGDILKGLGLYNIVRLYYRRVRRRKGRS